MTSDFPNFITCRFRDGDDGEWQPGYFSAWSILGEKLGDYSNAEPVAIVGYRVDKGISLPEVAFRTVPIRNIRMDVA